MAQKIVCDVTGIGGDDVESYVIQIVKQEMDQSGEPTAVFVQECDLCEAAVEKIKAACDRVLNPKPRKKRSKGEDE